MTQQALVFRNRNGAAALWLLPADDEGDAPEEAVLGGVIPDPRAQNMASKGSGHSWRSWAAYLSSQPLLGDWRLQELPDGLDAEDALGVVRRQDIQGP